MGTSERDAPAWTLEAIEKLQQLWNGGVEIEVICQTLGRPEAMVRAKAAELKLPQHVRPQ